MRRAALVLLILLLPLFCLFRKQVVGAGNEKKVGFFPSLACGALTKCGAVSGGGGRGWGESEGKHTLSPFARPPAQDAITVTGTVTNGTADFGIPTGAELILHVIDLSDLAETTYQTSLLEDGTFAFEGVRLSEQASFLVTLNYQDIVFASDAVLNPRGDPVEMPVQIFEPTGDPAVISVERAYLRIGFLPSGLNILEILHFHNSSDRIFITDEFVTEQRRVALTIPLPPGAGGLTYEDGREGIRYFEEDDALLDTQPVRPGRGHEVTFAYFVPYRQTAVIEQDFPYEVRELTLSAPAYGVTVTGEQLQDAGTESVEDVLHNRYELVAPLAAGSTLRYTLDGRPGAPPKPTSAPESAPAPEEQAPTVNIAGVLLLIGVLVGGGALGFYLLLSRDDGDDDAPRRRPARRETIIQMIADLDNRYELGEIAADYYHAERAALMQRLKESDDGGS